MKINNCPMCGSELNNNWCSNCCMRWMQENISMNKPEPMSIPNDNPAIWDLVEYDIRERDKLGTFKYKTRLQGFNGRDALKDAYQEALDLSVYLRQAIYERDGK